MKLGEYNNDGYKRGAFLKVIFWLLSSRIFFETFLPFPSAWKCFLLRIFGASIGNGVVIKPHVKIKYPWLLKISNDVWIGEQVWIDNLGLVRIHDNVCISQGAYILTGSHNYSKSSFDLIVKPVELKEGCWIGAKSIVCPGVVCNRLSVLTVGSVATSNLEDGSVYQGNPAKIRRKRPFES